MAEPSEKRPANQPEPARSGPPPAASPAPPVQLPAAADAQDEPGAPSYLPRSHDLSGWVKREPIRVAAAAGLTRVLSPEAVARMRHFAVKSAATVAYSAAVGPTVRTARILAIEAATADDAYGLTTCASTSADSDRCGGLTRVDVGPGLTFHTWQGRCYLRASIDGGSTEDREALRRLVLHVVSRIPREDPPALLHALPTPGAIAGRQWVIRHVGSLGPDTLGISPPPDLPRMGTLLGLDRDTIMAVSAYSVPGARRPNVIWVVQYPDEKQARAAHQRINSHLAGIESGPWLHTNVAAPKGRYLVGTWTAEEESLQYLIPRVLELLPS